jgi:hypothetical protein
MALLGTPAQALKVAAAAARRQRRERLTSKLYILTGLTALKRLFPLVLAAAAALACVSVVEPPISRDAVAPDQRTIVVVHA